MSILQGIVLGAIQGLTEFLPISSSGHLLILPELFNWEPHALAFDILLHFATLLAVIFYFRHNILRMFISLFRITDENYTADRRLLSMIIIGILPTVVVGYLFSDFIEKHLRDIPIVIINLIFWGLIFVLADFYAIRNSLQPSLRGNFFFNSETLTPLRTLFIGIFQVLSLIPGTSRSGITIAAGVFVKLNKKDGAHFSFLMSIPLILGASLFHLSKIGGLNNIPTTLDVNTTPYFISFVVALITGWIAIKLLVNIVETFGLTFFGLYRIVLGIALLLML